MAAKDKVEDVVVPTEKSRVEELVSKYNVRHHYRGSWKMDGDNTIYKNKDAAVQAAAAREVAELAEDDLSDIVPTGIDWASVTIKEQLVRGSVMELPMNERFNEGGERNPYYDREYQWAWAYKDRMDIARQRAKGYQPVEHKDFLKEVKSGKLPARMGDLVYEDGSYTVYGDSVLMRCPRYLHTQRMVEEEREGEQFLHMHGKSYNSAHSEHLRNLPRSVRDTLVNDIEFVDL